MRVDGSLKTVTAGVTSLDDKRHSGIFAKVVDNFRCDPMQGLSKRPATHFIGPLGSTFTEGTDVIFSALLQNTLYWVLILPGQGPSGSHQIRVFNVGNDSFEVFNCPIHGSLCQKLFKA